MPRHTEACVQSQRSAVAAAGVGDDEAPGGERPSRGPSGCCQPRPRCCNSLQGEEYPVPLLQLQGHEVVQEAEPGEE